MRQKSEQQGQKFLWRKTTGIEKKDTLLGCAKILQQAASQSCGPALRRQMRQVHAHATDPCASGNQLPLRSRLQFSRGVLGVGNVVIEERKIKPLHVDGTKSSSERKSFEIRADVVVHALLAVPNHNRAEIHCRHKPQA